MGHKKNILIVVTSHSNIADKHQTGLWLEELAVPYLAFKAKGYKVQLVSIQGGRAPVDPHSKPAPEQAKAWAEIVTQLENTPTIETVDAADFEAIFLPGGHGTMFDLPQNETLQHLLREFAEAGKVIAAVCHGPAGLVGATLVDGTPLVAGKTITSFTNEEEKATELDPYMPFLLETRLRELGGQFVHQPMWSDHAERDGNLITGQNPQSSHSVASAVIEALHEAERQPA